MAGQIDDRLAVASRKQGGLAGTNRDAMRQNLDIRKAQEDVHHQIAHPDGTTARQDHEIVVFQRTLDSTTKGRFVIGHDGKARRLGSACPHQSGDGVPVGIANLAGTGLPLHFHNLIACRDHGHTRAPKYPHLRNAQRR